MAMLNNQRVDLLVDRKLAVDGPRLLDNLQQPNSVQQFLLVYPHSFGLWRKFPRCRAFPVDMSEHSIH